MTGILRSPYLGSGLIALLLAAAWITRDPLLSGVMPLLAVAAWSYIVVRAIVSHRRRRAAPAPVDRSVIQGPKIAGEIAAPDTAPTIDPDEMQAYLSSRIIGQELVSEQLARGIFRRLAQERRGKPVFTALLSGPTGTGKTEMAKGVAGYMFGDSNAMFRIDCGNVLGEAGLQTLIGSPKGFAGSGTWGALTSHLRASPRTVLLFDEIEKAVTSPNAPMAKLLLSLLDEGICTEQSDGTKVSARDAVIMLTSNAAQEKLGAIFLRLHERPDELIRATKDALRDFFAPEFLARIDLVTTFSPLDNASRARIVALHVQRVAGSYGIDVDTVDASFVNEALRLWTALEGYGTREVIRWIEDAMADDLIQAKKAGKRSVRVSWADGAVDLESA